MELIISHSFINNKYMNKPLYNHLNDFYKNIFHERVLKIPLDGGFSCPNRDGTKGTGGCIFCSNRGSGDRLSLLPVEEQIDNYFSSFKAKKANKFIAYFQNYTNTYKDVNELKKIYDSALKDERIVGLDIATRPDCIDEEVVNLLSQYSKKYYVQVELGLQTANENSHLFINQNITNEEFVAAINLLNKHNIHIVIHLMVGLPNETHEDIVNTINFINKLDYNGIKIHSTYIENGTVLNELYKRGKYEPITYEYYMEELVYILTHINKEIIVHRITGDPYKETFVAPSWMMHKKKVINHIEEILRERKIYQGIFYE